MHADVFRRSSLIEYIYEIVAVLLQFVTVRRLIKLIKQKVDS